MEFLNSWQAKYPAILHETEIYASQPVQHAICARHIFRIELMFELHSMFNYSIYNVTQNWQYFLLQQPETSTWLLQKLAGVIFVEPLSTDIEMSNQQLKETRTLILKVEQ